MIQVDPEAHERFVASKDAPKVDESAIINFINSDDPLSDDALKKLIDHAEEDELVDYKQTFVDDKEHWLDLVIDVMSFANVIGGYLVFGVQNITWNIVGLDNEVEIILADANDISQRLAPYLDPPIESLRSKSVTYEGRTVVVVFVPQSKNITHVTKKEGVFQLPSKQNKTRFKIGELHVRISGGNRVASSRDIDSIFERRMELHRASLLKNIVQVVNSPTGSEVKIVASNPETGIIDGEIVVERTKRVPDFDATPSKLEEEIASCIALNKNSPDIIPPVRVVWKWYKHRLLLTLNEHQLLGVVKFGLLCGVPVCYWMQGLPITGLRSVISGVADEKLQGNGSEYVIKLACCIGSKFQEKIVKKYLKNNVSVSDILKCYPINGPWEYFKRSNLSMESSVRKSPGNIKSSENEIETIIDNSSKSYLHYPGVLEANKLRTLDYYLYYK